MIQTPAVIERNITTAINVVKRDALHVPLVVKGLCDDRSKGSPFGSVDRDLDRRPHKSIFIMDYDGVLYCDFVCDDSFEFQRPFVT
jgi:hypothetical protein